MRLFRFHLFVVLAFAVVSGSPVFSQTGGDSAGDVTVTLELNQHFYYAGDPFPVRVSVRNAGTRNLANPVKSPLLASFVVKAAGGGALDARGAGADQEPARPPKLAPGAFYGTVVDLAQLYPGLATPGEFEVMWSADGLQSQTLTVKMLPKYDPSKDYTASIDTPLGRIKIQFLPRVSPIAVKAFIDMANAGFYDGLLFHEVQANRYIVGGDPQFGDQQRVPFLYPAEQSSLPVVAGTVAMKPVRPSPPSNGSQFIVLLRPEPAWTGQVTIVGQIVEGLEVARAISRVPSTLQSSRPNFKPLKDVPIRRVSIEAREPRPAGENAGAGATGTGR